MQERAERNRGIWPSTSMQLRSVGARGRHASTRAALLFACLAAGPLPAAVHDVRLIDHSFVPATITIAPGDTVRWRNESSFSHNVVADSGQFSSGRPSNVGWTYERTFTASGEHPYHCAPHGGPGGQGMSGKVIVSGAPPAPPFVINEGIAGSWYNPATNGQGIFMEASDELKLMTLAWFTWTTTVGGYDWLTAVGPFDGRVATLTLNRSSGGRFNDGSSVVSTVAAGSALLTFHDCSRATLEFEMTAPVRTGRIELQRILPANQACIDANASASAD